MSTAADTSSPEDFMHRGVLKVVQNGFFVDIRSGGACALPLIPLFREHGWRGAEIEATQVSRTPAGLRDGQSTAWKYVALENGAEGSVDRALSDILERHSVTDLHFLSVDASGLRQQALADIDLVCWRPWVLMIRDPEGCACADDLSAWARTLQNAHYIPAYQSETNYFYIAMEQERLVKYFAAQPGTEGEFTNAPKAGVSSDTGTLARQNMPGQGLSREHRSSIETSGELLQTRGADLELRIARLEISQMRARLETAEAWARSASTWVEAAEARARSAENRANAAAAWANRGDVRLREMSVAAVNLRSKVVLDRETEIGRLHHHIAGMNDRVHALESRSRELEGRNVELEQRIAAIVTSTSWRVAAPLRAAPGPVRTVMHRLVRLPYRFIRRMYRRMRSPSYSAQMQAGAPVVQPAAAPRQEPATPVAPVTMAPVLQPQRVRKYAEMFNARTKEKVVEQI
jgi:hypothetical protein